MNLLRRSQVALRSLRTSLSRPPPQTPISRPKPPHIPRSRFPNPNPNPILTAPQWRRLYYVDSRQIQHFPRGRPARWYKNPRAILVVVILSGGIILTAAYGCRETVPYTKRTHFILISPTVERQLGESQFEKLKAALRGKILPALHPDSIRVRLISKEIIDAVQRGLSSGERHDMSYALDSPGEIDPAMMHESAWDTIVALQGGGGEHHRRFIRQQWSKEDEILDDSWVHETREDGKARGSQPAGKHLEGLNWEVLVVRDDTVNAFCLPGGKIVVFTGLLDHFRTDAEIATIIGHEVGHAIARHTAEMITKNLWFVLLQLILLQFFFMPDLINAMSTLLLRLPFSRRMEMEADYIGLMLLASSGYDPHVAPKVYEKLGQITGDSGLRDYLSTHPSSKKRAQLLSQAKVMEEALAIYREVVAGRGVEGFL